MNNNKEMKKGIFRYNFLLLKYVFKLTPLYAIISILFAVIHSIKAVIEVLLVKVAIESIISGASLGSFINDIKFLLIIEFCILLFTVVYEFYLIDRFNDVFVYKASRNLYNIILGMDMEKYDDPLIYDRIHKASNVAIYRSYYMFRDLISFINDGLSMLLIGSFIILNDFILILIALIAPIISSILNNKAIRLWYKSYDDTQNDHRFSWYIKRIFYQKNYLAEVKTTPIKYPLLSKYEQSFKNIDKIYKNTEKKCFVLYSLIDAADVIIVNCFSYIYLSLRLFKVLGLKYLIDIAGFMTLSQGITKFNNFMQMFASNIVTLQDNMLYFDDFIWVLNLKPVIERNEGLTVDRFENLRIENLSFTYSGSNQKVLNNLDFNIKSGEHVALVGVNGSGKSTLTKLILKFYQNQEGNIYYNDVNYNELNPKELRKRISVVFQDFNIYALSIAENVLLRHVESKADELLVINCLKMVGLYDKVKNLKDGIYTKVTKEFSKEGIEFSGGENQRLAISRIFATDADIYILDEPTASLDPLSEAQINKLIIDCAKDKTIIIIAHRLSTVVDCDRIYLLDDGNFKEVGSHQELMTLNKKYALMFNTQKSLYESK